MAAIDGPDRLRLLGTPDVWGEVESRMLEALGALGALRATRDPALAARRATVARRSTRLRTPAASRSQDATELGSPVPYPDGDDDAFPQRLAGLAAMLAAGLPLRCVALRAPGMYDTHADQPDDARRRRSQLTADSLLAFQRDLEARGLADRVLVHVWSEFGRRGAGERLERHRPRRRRHRRS